MKAVRIFMDITPKGVESSAFQEKVLLNKNDYWYTYKQRIEEKYGSVKKARNTLNWHEFIKIANK